ncbi:MAG TPA: phage tail protein I [Ancylobacter sp.]
MAARASILDLIPPPLKGDARVRALLAAFEAALDEQDAPDLMMLASDDVREEVLPYLGYEHSLDEFVGPGLPPPVIRQMIAKAWNLHEPKGYGEGVVGGIEMLGYLATLIQWWEESPQAVRGTHRIEVPVDKPLWPDRPLSGAEETRAIWRMIHAMQRWSQDHALRIISEAEVARPIGVGVLTGAVVQIEPFEPGVPEIPAPLYAGVGIVIGQFMQIEIQGGVA